MTKNKNDKINLKKIVFIGVIVFAVVIGLVIYQAIQSVRKEEIAQGGPVQVIKGSTGVTNIVTKDSVVKALGNKGSEVQGPDESKLLDFGVSRGQTSTFTFTSPASKNNSVDIDVRIYDTEERLKSVDPFKGTIDGNVKGIEGESRLYFPNEAGMPNRQVGIILVKGKASYKFSIVQPFDGRTFTTDEARNALIAIINSANFDVVK